MGLIVRESTAPIANGETADGAEVEAEFNKLFNEFNGNMSNANIRSDADISGTKLLVASTPGAKMQADSITTKKLAAAAVPKGYVATSTGTENFTTNATFTNLPDVSFATMTPGSTDDFIFCDLTLTMGGSGGASNWEFGFMVNGTDSGGLIRVTNVDVGGQPWASKHVSWAQTAPATTSMIIKPRYRKITGSGAGVYVLPSTDASQSFSKIFRVLIVPTK